MYKVTNEFAIKCVQSAHFIHPMPVLCCGELKQIRSIRQKTDLKQVWFVWMYLVCFGLQVQVCLQKIGLSKILCIYFVNTGVKVYFLMIVCICVVRLLMYSTFYSNITETF